MQWPDSLHCAGIGLPAAVSVCCSSRIAASPLDNWLSVKQELLGPDVPCLLSPQPTGCSQRGSLIQGQTKPVLGPQDGTKSMTQGVLQSSQGGQAEILHVRALSGSAPSHAPCWPPAPLQPEHLLSKQCASQRLHHSASRELVQSYRLVLFSFLTFSFQRRAVLCST